MSVSRSSVRQSVSQSASQSMIFHLRKIGTEKHIWTSGFYEYEHIYTYQRQEFQIIFQKKNHVIPLDSCYLFTKRMLKMELNMMFWKCMWSLHTLGILERNSIFDEYLAIWADDELENLLVCNIMFDK